MFQLLYLHWGQITQNISLAGGDASSGGVTGISGSAKLTSASGEAKTTGIQGSGGVSTRTSSRRNNGIGGSGGSNG